MEEEFRILNRKIYWGLVLGIFTSSVTITHGGIVPVIILEILGLSVFFTKGEINHNTLAIILAALVLQFYIIIFSRKNLDTQRKIWILVAAILFLNGLTIFAGVKQDNNYDAKVVFYSSIILFLSIQGYFPIFPK